jgi:aspartate-semialdehyde dehydrogenase
LLGSILTRKYHTAIVGATGLVGQEFIKILEQREFPMASVHLLASDRSAGKKLFVNHQEIEVEEVTPDSFDPVDIALFSAGSEVSKHFAPIAAKRGAVVVDNSAAFRMNPDVPLVVPEVNPEDLEHHQGIIANPNCSTIQMVVALYPLHKVNPIKRIVVDTYQAVSGTGSAAVDELNSQTKLILETRKILHDESLAVSATCVRVPVVTGHSEAIHIEFTNPMSPEAARNILATAPGVKVLDDTPISLYPHPWAAAGTDEVFVGRIRRDASHPNGLALWVVADNLRKGAALNTIQIAEQLISKGWL